MALVKSAPPETEPGQTPSQDDGASILLDALWAEEPGTRRAAARELARHTGCGMALCDRLELEKSPSVRAVILTSLICVRTPEIASRLAVHLHSEDTQLRNAAIEALQDMDDVVMPLLQTLLEDPDSDVRIFAVNILATLRHLSAKASLAEVIRADSHINVCAAAVDGLAEIGGPEQVADLAALAERFADSDFIRFAVATAISRIGGA